MATKKIPELASYGSRTSPLSKKDLYEVSKADGTYGSPTYGTGTSRQITHEELVDAIGGIPYSGQNYEVVKAVGTPTQNGTALLVAAAACYAKTPNGLALSNTNRAVVYFLAGKYNIGVSIINIGEFVDFYCIGNASDCLIYGNTGNSVFFIETDNDYSFSNFSIENTSTGKSVSMNFGDTDNGKWDNIILKTATNREIVWNGQYNNITGLVDEVMNGSLGADCVVSNSTFQNKSCGYSETESISIAGKIINCTGIDYCFGHSTFGSVDVSGTIDNVTGRDYCFAFSSVNSSSVDISGRCLNSTGRNFCFSATSSVSTLVEISGEVINCLANATSYSYSATDGNHSISGKISNSNATWLDCYGSTTPTGIIKNSKGLNSHGLHEGLIDGGYFKNEDASIRDVIKINDGAIVKYSSIVQLEDTMDSIKVVSGAEVKIAHCETNQDFNLISGDPYTNLIAIPYNVIDSNLTE